MTYLSLKKWSGQFGSNKVIAQVRRAIRGRIAGGECLVVLDDSAKGITNDVRVKIQEGWPTGKVLFSHTHPLLAGQEKTSRRRRPQ